MLRLNRYACAHSLDGMRFTTAALVVVNTIPSIETSRLREWLDNNAPG